MNDANGLSAAALAERLAAGPAPPLLLAKALLSIDRAATVLQRHLAALDAARPSRT
jgi:hypothetical protein